VENELTGVGVFAFVTFERHLAEAHPNRKHQQDG